MKLKYNKEKKEWIELPKGSKEEGSIYLDGYLKEKLDNVRHIISKNWDCVFIIDGDERIGKSTLGLTCAYYLDPNITISNISNGAEECKEKIRDLPDKSILIVDEGSLVFLGKDAMRREQRELMKILNVVGQKNMIFIILCPCFFDLNKQIAVRRSRFLIHVYTDIKLNRGRWAYWGTKTKRKLYGIGKKNYDSYSYPQYEKIGRFTDFNPLGQPYFEVKKKALMEAMNPTGNHDIQPSIVKRINIRILKNLLEMDLGLTIKQLGVVFGVSERTIMNYKENMGDR